MDQEARHLLLPERPGDVGENDDAFNKKGTFCESNERLTFSEASGATVSPVVVGQTRGRVTTASRPPPLQLPVPSCPHPNSHLHHQCAFSVSGAETTTVRLAGNQGESITVDAPVTDMNCTGNLTNSLRQSLMLCSDTNLNDTLGRMEKNTMTGASRDTQCRPTPTAMPGGDGTFGTTLSGTLGGLGSLRATLKEMELLDRVATPSTLPPVSQHTRRILERLYQCGGDGDAPAGLPGPLPLFEPLTVGTIRRRFGESDILTMRVPVLPVCSVWSIASSTEVGSAAAPTTATALTSSPDAARNATGGVRSTAAGRGDLQSAETIKRSIEQRKQKLNAPLKSATISPVKNFIEEGRKPARPAAGWPVKQVPGSTILEEALRKQERQLRVKWSKRSEKDRMLHKVQQWCDRTRLEPVVMPPLDPLALDADHSVYQQFFGDSSTPKYEEDPDTAHERVMDTVREDEQEVLRRNTVERRRAENQELRPNLQFVEDLTTGDPNNRKVLFERVMVSADGRLPAHRSLVQRLNPFDQKGGDEAEDWELFDHDHHDGESSDNNSDHCAIDATTPDLPARPAPLGLGGRSRHPLKAAAEGRLTPNQMPTIDGKGGSLRLIHAVEKELLEFFRVSVVDGTSWQCMQSARKRDKGCAKAASLVESNRRPRQRHVSILSPLYRLTSDAAEFSRQSGLGSPRFGFDWYRLPSVGETSLHDRLSYQEEKIVSTVLERVLHARDLCVLSDVQSTLREVDGPGVPASMALPLAEGQAGVPATTSLAADAPVFAALPMTLTFSSLPPGMTVEASEAVQGSSLTQSDLSRVWTVQLDGVSLLQSLPEVAIRAIFQTHENERERSKRQPGLVTSVHFPKVALAAWHHVLMEIAWRDSPLRNSFSVGAEGLEKRGPAPPRHGEPIYLLSFSLDLRLALLQTRYRTSRLKELCNAWNLRIKQQQQLTPCANVGSDEDNTTSTVGSPLRERCFSCTGSVLELEYQRHIAFAQPTSVVTKRVRLHSVGGATSGDTDNSEGEVGDKMALHEHVIAVDNRNLDRRGEDPLKALKFPGPSMTSNGILYAPPARGCYQLDMKNLYVMASLASEESVHVLIPRLAQIRDNYHALWEKAVAQAVQPPSPLTAGLVRSHQLANANEASARIGKGGGSSSPLGNDGKGVLPSSEATRPDGTCFSSSCEAWRTLRTLLELETDYAMNLRHVHKNEVTILQFNQHVEAYNAYQRAEKSIWAPLYRSGLTISYLLCTYLRQHGLERLPEPYVPFLHPVALFVGCSAGHRELRVKLKEILVDIVDRAKRVEVQVAALPARLLEDAAVALQEVGSASDIVCCLATEEDVIGVALAPVSLPGVSFQDIPALSAPR